MSLVIPELKRAYAVEYGNAFKDDFRNFLHLGLTSLAEDEPDVWGPPTAIQYDVAQHLCKPIKRIALLGHRKFGKSVEIAFWAAWRLWRNPNEKILFVSEAEDFATQLSSFLQAIVRKLPELSDLLGRKHHGKTIRVKGSAASITPSIGAIGLWGQIQGWHPSILIIDDSESSKNTETPTQRHRVFQRQLALEPLPLDRTGQVVMAGTLQCEESTYLTLADRGYDVMWVPQRHPTPTMRRYYGDGLPPSMVRALDADPTLGEGGGCDKDLGKPADPTRYSEEFCCAEERALTKLHYYWHNLLFATPPDAARRYIQCRDLTAMDLSDDLAPDRVDWIDIDMYAYDDKELPCWGLANDRWLKPAAVGDMRPYRFRAMSIDPSGITIKGDEVGWTIGGIVLNNLFINDWGGLAGGPSKANLEYLAKKAVEKKVRVVYVEKNLGGGAWGRLFARYLSDACRAARDTFPGLHHEPWRCGVVDVTATGQKEKRIGNAIGPVSLSHRIIVNRRRILSEQQEKKLPKDQQRNLWWQAARLTDEPECLPKDDRIDALAILVQELATWVALDPVKQREKLLMADHLAEWHNWDGTPGEEPQPEKKRQSFVAHTAFGKFSNPPDIFKNKR